MTTKGPPRSPGLTAHLELWQQEEQKKLLALSLETVKAREARLIQGLKTNDEMPAEDRDKEWWESWWHLEARYRYTVAYRQRIEASGKAIGCGTHPFEGATANVRHRPCDRCATEQVGAIASHLQRRWEEKQALMNAEELKELREYRTP